MKWVPVGPIAEIASRGGRKLFTAGEFRLAVFQLDDKWVAIDNHCPHRGGPIAAGEWQGTCLTCPWHAAQYDLSTGQPLSLETSRLRFLDTRMENGVLEVDVDSLKQSPVALAEDGIQRFLVRYGRGGEVGLFGTVHQSEVERNDTVIIQTHRGTEVGIILQDASQPTSAAVRGELIRLATNQDLETQDEANLAAAKVLDQATLECRKLEVPVQLVDSYQTLDESTTIIYFIGEDSAALGPAAVAMGKSLGRSVRFQKLKLE